MRAPHVRSPALVLAAPLVAAFVAALVVGNSFLTDVVVTVFLYAALSLAWNLVGGYAGQFSLGHTAFFGIGAYTSTLLFLKLGVSPWIGMIAGAALAAAVGLAVLTPCFRLKGFYFALATIAFAEVAKIVAVTWRSLTQGSVGLLLPIQPSLGNMLFTSKVPFLVMAFGLVTALVAVSIAIDRSRFGYYLKALREDEAAAKALGIDVVRYKAAIMAVSAAFTAVAGTFHTQYLSFVDPDVAFSMHLSLQISLFAIIGGIGTVGGPVVGALLLVPLDAVLKGWLGTLYAGVGSLVYGLILIGVVLVMPDGIVKALGRLRGRPASVAPAEGNGEDVLLPPPAVHVADGTADVLVVQGLFKRFGGLQAIADVTLHVKRGEILGIIGPNGAGKSTLFGLLSTFIRPDRGSIRYNGRELAGVSAPHRVCLLGMARTFQLVKPFANLTVLENTMTGAFSRARSAHAARAHAASILRFVGLDAYANRPASSLTLSGRKRMELARALATRPALLLLDEVMAGLNPREVSDMIRLLRRISRSGVSIVVIEHLMKAIMELSDRIVVLDYGRVIAQGTPAEVVADQAVVDAYLGKEGARARG